MKTQKITTIITLIASLALFSCVEPGEKTAIGAATGGAIGAGLGAIVGNQAGSPGGGLAIGAVAGASTGAMIANAMEAQDKGMREQEEAIERQEQTIKVQKAQIEELRRGTDSKYAPGDRFASGSGFGSSTGKSYDTSKAAPGDLYLSNSTARVNTSSQAPSSYPRASSNLSDSAIVHETTSHKEVSAPAPSLSEPTTTDVESPKPILETDLVTSAPEVSNPPAAAPEISHTEFKPLDAPTEASGAAAVVSQAESTQECSNADAEVKKADQASDAGDKLFHYRRALRLCPKNSNIHAAIGDLYLTLGRKDDAVFEYEEGLKVDPNSASLKNKLSSAKG